MIKDWWPLSGAFLVVILFVAIGSYFDYKTDAYREAWYAENHCRLIMQWGDKFETDTFVLQSEDCFRPPEVDNGNSGVTQPIERDCLQWGCEYTSTRNLATCQCVVGGEEQ